MKILIADDHEVVRVGIRKLLVETHNPEQIAEACDGIELTQMLRQLPFDFLIVDVSMPTFDPLSELQTIRTQYPAMFILVVSAYDDSAYVQGLLSAGVHGYHLKDQPFKDLLLAIDSILQGEIWLSRPLIKKILSPSEHRNVELSSRQIDIARGLSNGLSNKEIAEHLMLSTKTVENHLTRLYHQLNVNSRLEAVKYIHENPRLLGQRGQVVGQSVPVTLVTSSGYPILVVDDNQRFRKQLASIIGRNFPHASIYEAGDWQELQMIANQISPALIFLDVVLGNENGISLTRKIKQKLPDTKIVLITAYPDREFHRMGLEVGAIALIDKKDLDTATIKQIVYDVIG